ncbi:hypothetical protein AYJ57_13885 [Salipiger sp. CCB-MM3]|uniref:sulfotransferase family protein n=1 Tax=Salipiger sp. CCB-MM3 TaxID=1792508 RepID=UPI00080AAD31|nr:sulfotransferase family protein [Salipiger sp. CCB-MM3]ANT61364.1 hypothetical protein AYJ57_13885 [Salipiger sp. CCB-MM3]
MIVVNLGLPKSGTTTLGVALQRAGLRVADYRLRRGKCPDPSIAGSFVARQLYDGYFGSGDPLQRLGGLDALTEISVLNTRLCLWPQTDFGLIEALRSRHPELKFLASTRDPQAMAHSMLRWSDLGSNRLPRGAVPGLPAGYGETRLERAQWIAAHHAFLARIFADDPRFLAYDIEDPEAPARISAHLGVDLPWWGKANENLSGRRGAAAETP